MRKIINMNERLKSATYGKRFLGYLLDSVLVLAGAFTLYFSVMSTTVYKNMGGYDLQNAEASFMADSGVFTMTKNDSGTYTGYSIPTYDAVGESKEKDGWQLYYNDIRHCYLEFMPIHEHIDDVQESGKDTKTKASDYYTVSYFNVKVLGLPEVSSITDFSKETNYSSAYFKYVLNDAGTAVDLSKAPVLKSEYATLSDARDTTGLTSLKEFFYNSTSTTSAGKTYDIANHLYSSESYIVGLRQERSMLSWYVMMLSLFPSAFIFVFLIPLFTKNGATIGKLLLKEAVLGKNGYSISIKERIIRSLYMLIVFCLPAASPFLIYNIMGLLLFVLIDYIFMATSKDGMNRTLHDRLAGTVVVDAKNSFWFASEAAEEEYYETHPATPIDDAETLYSKEEALRIERENSILDLSTLNRHREEAAKMTSFDEFESTSVPTAPLHKESDADKVSKGLEALAAEKEAEEKEKAKKEVEEKENPKAESEKEENAKPDESGFTDDSK